MPKKLTQTEVIARFRKAHGDHYDYSRVVYVGSSEKVTVVCPDHGAFEIVPGHHMKGTGCRKCYADRQRLTLDEFIRKARSHHGERYGYELVPNPFPGCQFKVLILCRAHGVTFNQEAKAHMSGHTGCPECLSDLLRGPVKGRKCGAVKVSPTSDFVTKARVVHGNRYDYKKTVYRRCRDKIWIRCRDHGAFKQTPTNHLRGSGCPDCGRMARRKGSLKERCAELGLNYWRVQKRVLAGMPLERALCEGYVRANKETATAVIVCGVRYPNILEACRNLKPPASPATVIRWIRAGMSPDEAFEKDPKPGFAHGIIYKITQLSTNKVYIGQTVQTRKERWDRHIEQAMAGSIESELSLHHAIRIFGQEDFRIKQVDEGESSVELAEKEKKWIDRLGTLAPDGFNLNRGGSTGGSQKKPCEVDGQRFESRGDAINHVALTRGISREAAAKRLEVGRLDVKAPAKAGQSLVKTKEYKAWSAMKDTVSPRSRSYVPGIELHPAWRKNFDAWLAEAGMAPSSRHRYARIDKRKGFVPENCAWMTPAEDAKARIASNCPLFGGVKPRHVRIFDR